MVEEEEEGGRRQGRSGTGRRVKGLRGGGRGGCGGNGYKWSRKVGEVEER